MIPCITIISFKYGNSLGLDEEKKNRDSLTREGKSNIEDGKRKRKKTEE